MSPPIQPQPRHLDTAIGAMATQCLYASGHVATACNPPTRCCTVCQRAYPIARALAEAENRAAWDGYDFGVSAREMYSECESKYGPRPTTENQA